MSKDKATNKYTQREWDRTVGWGSVPDEYKHESEKEQNNGLESVQKIKLAKGRRYCC